MRTPADILRDVASSFGVDPIDVTDASNCTRTPLRVRRIVAYVLRVDRGLSYGEVARTLGASRPSVFRLVRSQRQQPDPRLAEFLGGDA